MKGKTEKSVQSNGQATGTSKGSSGADVLYRNENRRNFRGAGDKTAKRTGYSSPWEKGTCEDIGKGGLS